jgi:hypothetical protein
MIKKTKHTWKVVPTEIMWASGAKPKIRRKTIYIPGSTLEHV